MGSILFLGFALLALLPAGPLIVWVLKPIRQASQKLKRPFRFSLSDLFTLVVMCQLPMPLFANLVWEASLGAKATIVGLLCLVMSILWVRGIQLLANAGISKREHRFFFLVVILPATFLGAVLVGLFAIGFLTAIVFPPPDDSQVAVTMVGVELVLIAVLFFCRRLVQSMVAAASVTFEETGEENPGEDRKPDD